MTIKEKAVSGMFWTFSQQFLVQGINFVVSIILARILLPAEFGLLGLVAIFIAIGVTLVENGFTSSIIRTQDADQEDYSTVFFINMGGSIIMYLLVFLSSPLIAQFYDQLILIDLLRVYCLIFIINAFSTVQRTMLTKIMDFKSQLTVALPSLIGGSCIGVFLALHGYGVWSLVFMNLFQSLLSSIFFWIKAGWKPSFIINTTKLKYHFNFGYKLSLANLISTIYEYAYHIIIGRMFSVSQLGYYTRADSMKQLPVANISVALNKVTYPLFASIQNDDIKLKVVYKKLMQQVLFWIAPVLVIAGILAEPLFRFLLTEKWLPSVPIFQILCIVGIMYPLHSYNINILNVKGRSDLVLKLEIIKKIIVSIGLLFSIQYGFFGLLWMQVILNLLSFGINTFYSGKLVNYPLKEQIQDLSPILAISLISGIITYLLVYELISLFTADLIILAFGSVFGLLVYLILSYIAKINALFDFKLLILKQ